MNANSLFLIYGRVNDKLVIMARHLKAAEVTATAKKLSKESERGEILILEETQEADKKRQTCGKAAEALRNLKVIS